MLDGTLLWNPIFCPKSSKSDWLNFAKPFRRSAGLPQFPRLRTWHDGLHVWFGGHFPHDLGLPKERAGCGWQPMATTYLGPWHGGLQYSGVGWFFLFNANIIRVWLEKRCVPPQKPASDRENDDWYILVPYFQSNPSISGDFPFPG